MKLHVVGGGIFNGNLKALVLLFLHSPRESPDIFYAKPPASTVKILKPFTKGPDVYIEDFDFYIGEVLLNDKGAFNRVHTADIGAVLASLVGGS
jgi:hypothetical protein